MMNKIIGNAKRTAAIILSVSLGALQKQQLKRMEERKLPYGPAALIT